MRLWILSDLHLEDGIPPPTAAPDFDVLICAGDIVEAFPAACVETVAGLARGRPAIMVLGNHDVWGQPMEDAVEKAQARGAELGVHVLEDTAVELGGVRFHGATLWTETLPPSSVAPTAHLDRKFVEPVYMQGPTMDQRATVRDILERSELSQRAIAAAVHRAKEDGSLLALVTHHAPYPNVFSAAHPNDPTAVPADSCLRRLTTSRVALWVHGHFHRTVDFIADSGTRVVCNARGGRFFANADFDPGMVIEISSA